jgi:glucose-6-phosphate isomerase
MSEPIRLEPDAARGVLAGSSDRYEKRLAELAGVYRDEAAFRAALDSNNGDPVYWVEASTPDSDAGALTIGISVLQEGHVGDEFAMTRGHIHAQHSAAELYYGLSGRGVMLMETVDGQTSAIEITPGVAVHVPGHWIHRSVNVGEGPFTTLFCDPSDAGQDYSIIGDAGGMSKLVVASDSSESGWELRDNPDHQQYEGTSR